MTLSEMKFEDLKVGDILYSDLGSIGNILFFSGKKIICRFDDPRPAAPMRTVSHKGNKTQVVQSIGLTRIWHSLANDIQWLGRNGAKIPSVD